MEPGLADELPAPQRLALAHAPRRASEATLAVFALDCRLAAFLRRGQEPLLAQMRLAWWRDRLAEDPGKWPQGDPLLELLGSWDRPASLGPLVDGWECLLGETLGAQAIDTFAAGRAAAFAALAAELRVADTAAKCAGRTWALADLAANLSDPAERQQVVAQAAGTDARLPKDRALRPLAILGGLGRRAIMRGGRPLLEGRGAALVAMRVGLFGR